MKIKFNQKYKSITEFQETDINDFSVFLGVNGSGKTHLLKSLQEGFVLADQISKENISYFNLQTFLIKNQKSIAPRNIDDEKSQAWKIINEERYKPTFENYDKQIKELVGDVEYPYSVEDEMPANKAIQYNQIQLNLLKYIKNITKNRGLNAKIKNLLATGILDSKKFVTEIKQAEFFKTANYDPDDYELLESLSEVFLDYHKKLIIAKLPVEEGGEGLNIEEFEKRSNLSPWHFVNEMFREFGFMHSISSPEFTIAEMISTQSVPFQANLTIGDEEISFEDLSSGEKILCALAITIYQNNKSKFPELLLLDEVDASLHPSMTQNLLDVINNIFLKNNCKVILATHSPTTVALVSEESLFEIKKGKEQQKIKKISQSDAVELLSEGIITFEKGLKIQNKIDNAKQLQIITEGNNTEHIRKAIEILDASLLSKINLIEGVSDKSGDQQLKNAFDIMSKANFDKKFLFVWDCDFLNKFENIAETNNFKKFCFEINPENTKATNNAKAVGIENLYPDTLFTTDVYSTKEKTGSYGATNKIQEFNKQNFLEKIKQQTENTLFSKFQPLIDKINEIISQC